MPSWPRKSLIGIDRQPMTLNRLCHLLNAKWHSLPIGPVPPHGPVVSRSRKQPTVQTVTSDLIVDFAAGCVWRFSNDRLCPPLALFVFALASAAKRPRHSAANGGNGNSPQRAGSVSDRRTRNRSRSPPIGNGGIGNSSQSRKRQRSENAKCGSTNPPPFGAFPF
jgi:hypothetical protein